MALVTDILDQLDDPSDYFSGVGRAGLPTPTQVLLFARRNIELLQQEALQNRSHHRFVLIYNLGTAGHVHVDNLVLPFSPGQSLLIHPFQFHHFSRLAKAELAWLFCTFELHPTASLEPLRNVVLDTSARTQRAWGDVLSQWVRCSESTGGSALTGELLQAAALDLLLSLRQNREATAEDLPTEPSDDLLRMVNRLMSQMRGRPVGVADIAASLQLSSSRLRSRFRDAAGIPLGSYLRNYRLNRAMALLRTTGLSIADIATEAGCGSPQAFSRMFKLATGRTPRDYRRSL